MSIKVDVKGNFEKAIALMEKYTKIRRQSTVRSKLNEFGQKAVDELSSRAPVESGEYASGFRYELDDESGKLSAVIYNDSHPEVKERSGSSLTTLLSYGHGTGTGGYVPANKFVEEAGDKIKMESLGEVITNVE